MRRFGLIGKTLEHSFSKAFFAQKFTDEDIIDCSYENYELQDIDEIGTLVQQNPDLVGLNVTIPYKESVIRFLDDANGIVREAGACNCIKIVNGKLKGFNTDAIAFEKVISSHLKAHHKCALILGTGGASKAVQFALRKLGMDFLLVTRNKKDDEIGYEDLGREMIEGHQLIVNTTPLGMYPNIEEDPPIPYEYIGVNHLLFDMIYNPPETKFLLQGKRQGAQVCNGYEMLVQQAEESWRIWNDPEL